VKIQTWEVVRLNDDVQSQFRVEGQDLLSLDQFQFSETALMAVLVELEHGHPGTLAFVVRLMALAADGWQFTARASNPTRSLQIQGELVALLIDIDKSLSTHERKGGILNGHQDERGDSSIRPRATFRRTSSTF